MLGRSFLFSQPTTGGEEGGFCWDAAGWGQSSPSPPAAPPAPPPARPGPHTGAGHLPQPRGKSAAAALSAQLAARAAAAAQPRQDAFCFHAEEGEAPPPAPLWIAAAAPGAAGRVTAAAAATALMGRQQGSAAPPPAPRAPASAAPPAACSLTLDRYLDLLHLLTKGSGRVQPLSQLERSLLKHSDLKQVLLLSGLHHGSRTKKDMMDRLGGLELFDPACLLEHEPQGGAADAAPGGAAMLDAEALSALDWVRPPGDLLAQAVSGGSSTRYSCCPLPPVRVRLPAGVAPAPPTQPAQQLVRQQRQLTSTQADSDATLASEGAACHAGMQLQSSPGVVQPQPPPQLLQQQPLPMLPPPPQQQQQPGAAQEAATGACIEKEEEGGAEVAEWLAEGVRAVGLESQGSADAVAGKQLVGRRVAFVLLEEFEQADSRGVVDRVEAGVQHGQVVEFSSSDCDDCPQGCAEQHAWCYVRVRSSAVPGTGPLGAQRQQQQRRRLDLVVDLQKRFRQQRLEDLLGLGDAALQDAWVLLEARPEGEEEFPATAPPALAGPWRGSQLAPTAATAAAAAKATVAAAATAAAAAAVTGGGGPGWRQAKRTGGEAGAQPPPKRQCAAAGGRESALVWATFAGSWWPARLLEGQLGGSGSIGGASAKLRVQLLGCGVTTALPPVKVEAFGEQRQARLGALQGSELGCKAAAQVQQLLGRGVAGP